MESGPGKNRIAALILAVFACAAAREAAATDFTDPGDMITYMHRQRASHSTLPEIDGTIESTTTAKPGWYGLNLKLDNGRMLRVIVAPSTKFFKDYAQIDPPAAYPMLTGGTHVRALHDPDRDVSLRNIVITDLMFESPPVELDGTIKAAVTTAPGVYDLTVNLDKGGEQHLSIDQKTKFWKDYKAVDAKAAYPQLTAGQKFRAMEKPAPGGERRTSDLMFTGP